MSRLADAVLPGIRTRSDLHRWSAANAHGRQMHEAIDVLEAAIPQTEPAEVYSVTHRALASAIKVVARADDSSGIIGDACRRLLDLHPRAAAAAQIAPRRLMEWMLTFQFDGDVDFFDLDPLTVLPVHRRLVEQSLVHAGAGNYRSAARRLERMRRLAAGSHRAGEVDDLVAQLRDTHRRRPRLQREFDRAGLP